MHGVIAMARRNGRNKGRKGSKGRGSVDLEQRARPTPERLRQAAGHWERGDTGQITLRDSPLERAHGRGVITREQYDAGVKYRHHWYHAGLADALGSADLNRIFATDVTGFSGMAKTEAQVFHRQRFRQAVTAVGEVGARVLDQCVCRELPLDQAGYTLGWGGKPQAISAATERLRAALDVLCRLWGIGG